MMGERASFVLLVDDEQDFLEMTRDVLETRSPADLAAMQADAFIEKPTQPAELPAKATDLLRGGEAEKGS